MQVSIVIDCNNAAFADSPDNEELASILERTAKHLRLYGSFSQPVTPGDHVRLYDTNGNHVGNLTAK